MICYDYAERPTMASVYPTWTDFEDDYENQGYNLYDVWEFDADSTLKKMAFTLLLARYGGSRIAYTGDGAEARFRARFASIFWQYGPTWARQVQIQSALRKLSLDEISQGTKQISDLALNPSTVPEGPNVVDGEITTVNQQTKLRYKKGPVDSLVTLSEVLRKDVTEDFVSRFKRLFISIPYEYNEREDGE